MKAGRGDRAPAERSAICQYEYHRDSYLVPMLGTERLGQLNQARIMAFRGDPLEKLSRPLTKKVLTRLKGILSEMQDRGRVAINHAARVKIGAATRDDDDEAELTTIADIKAILEKLDELSTPDGMPIGTITSKAWMRRRVLVCTAVHRLEGKHVRQRADETVIGATKSKAGRRTIPIPPALYRCCENGKSPDLVFPSETGRPQSLSNIDNQAWRTIQIAAGVCDPVKDDKGKVKADKDGKPVLSPRYNFHGLRHFHASMLIADGANSKEGQVDWVIPAFR